MNSGISSSSNDHSEHEKTLERYFSKAVVAACVLGFSVHFVLIFFCFSFEISELAYYNIGSCLFFLFGYFSVRRNLRYTQLIFILASLEVLIHAILATYFVGPESGFHLFSWVILPVMVLNSNFRLSLVLLGFAFISGLQLLFVFSDVFNPAVYLLEPWKLEISFQVCTFSVFFTLFLVIFYYRRIVQFKNAQMISEKESRIAANEELEQRANDMEDLVRTVAHDIKGSLNNISELSRLMESKNELQESDKQMVGMIRTSSDSLKDFVVGLMNYSMSKEQEIKKQEIELDSLIQELRDIFCQDATVSLHLDAAIPEVYGDKRLLFRVLRNLVENGIKYNSSESPEVTIEVTKTSDEFKFEVLDNGIGIASEDQERIFELFEIVGEKDRFGNEGTGFGLASTKNIIESMGGILKCESILGKGSVFTFTIAK